jgi:tetratricopeptide (TPR) repeat protein
VRRAAEQLEESLLHARRAGDLWGVSNVLPHLGNLRLTQGEHALAATITEDALAHARTIGNQRGMAVSLNVLGLVALAQGDRERAQSCHQESLRVAQDAGLTFQQAAALRFLGRLSTDLARVDAAQSQLLSALKLYRRMQDRLGIALCLIDLADAARLCASFSIAVEALSAADAIISAIGAGLVEPEHSQYQRILAATERSLRPPEWQRAWTAGQNAAIETLIARLEQPLTSAPAEARPLTSR